MSPEHTESVKSIMDGISVATVLGAMTQYLPPIASLLTVVWMAIRIYESNTVQKLLGNTPVRSHNQD